MHEVGPSASASASRPALTRAKPGWGYFSRPRARAPTGSRGKHSGVVPLVPGGGTNCGQSHP
eukprot:9486070-Pyramimonas_sp.AAC.1